MDATAPAGDDARATTRRRTRILAGVAAVTLAGIAAYLALTRGRESTDDAQVTADLVPVAARVGGAITRVAIRENQPVTRGDLIAEIDPAEAAAKARQAEAELATAQAQAQIADAQVAVVEASAKGGYASARAALSGSSVAVGGASAQLEAARGGLKRAEADARRTAADLTRARALFEARAIPRERIDHAEAADEAAQAALDQARAQVDAAEDARRMAQSRVGEAEGHVSQSAPFESQIAAARAGAELAHARVQAAQAAVELGRLALSYTRIVAPQDGVASRLSVHEGQLVAPGQPIVEIVPNATYVIANFKETQVGAMRPGQRAEIDVDAFSARRFEGRVESVSGGTGASFSLLPADNATGNFVKVVQRVPVRIAWSPPRDVAMRAGLSATVTVHVQP